MQHKPLIPAALCGILLSAMPFLPLAQAAGPRAVDARTLDIAGVRTGMDYDEVVKALTAHFNAAPGDIKADPFPGENIVTRTKLPSYVKYEKDGTSVTVNFEGRVPPDPARPLVAWRIGYEVPWSQQNAAQMVQAAASKYGTQSNAPNTLPMQWCAHPSANTGIGCNVDEAQLSLSQVAMTLTDPAWQQARIKYVQDRQAVRPNL